METGNGLGFCGCTIVTEDGTKFSSANAVGAILAFSTVMTFLALKEKEKNLAAKNTADKEKNVNKIMVLFLNFFSLNFSS